MNIENVTRLRDFLLSIPREAFDYETFKKYSTDDYSTIEVNGEHVCGTSACIAGWCVVLNENSKQLWKLDDRNHIKFSPDTDFFIEGREFLELSENEAMIVFAPFDIDYEDYEDYGDFIINDDEEAVALYHSLYTNATNLEAAEFLTRMIDTGEVDIRWWGEIREASNKKVEENV